MEFNALLTKRMALGWAGMALIWTAITAQAQVIAVYPSQDDPTKTIWIFRDFGGEPFYGSSIRTGANTFHRRDSWRPESTVDNSLRLYAANKPTNQLFNLGSTNAIDIESVRTRLAGSTRATSIFYSGVTFPTNATNTPTMAVFTNSVLSASKTLGNIFMNAGAAADEFGIRGSGGGNLVYTTNDTFHLFGSGIMNKPISDFSFPSDTSPPRTRSIFSSPHDLNERPYFHSAYIDIYRHVIPDPAEYALVFGLFAIGFVFFRHFRKKPPTKIDL